MHVCVVFSRTHEDDARLVLSRVSEHFSNESRALANVLINNGRRNNLEKVALHVRSDGSREERLARARRSVEQHALRRLDPDPQKELRVEQW